MCLKCGFVRGETGSCPLRSPDGRLECCRDRFVGVTQVPMAAGTLEKVGHFENIRIFDLKVRYTNRPGGPTWTVQVGISKLFRRFTK